MNQLKLLIFILFLSLLVHSQDKEWEKDVIYSEKQVPHYQLPDPLVTTEGNRVTTVEQWVSQRRPQIMGMFASTIYGHVPLPESPIEVNYENLVEDEDFFDGRATKKIVLATCNNQQGKVEMHIALFLPNDVNTSVPVLLVADFGSINERSMDMNNIQSYGRLNNGIPLIDLFAKGFGVAVIQGGEIIPDEINFNNSIQKLYYKENQTMPKADEWGVLAGISWQLSRTLDFLETQPEVDAQKVAVLGFSKLGKSTLWAGAQDSRFAMVLSQNSGAAGAALWKRNFGENLKYMTRFPNWLCGNAKKFVGLESDLPVDQHMLIACIAPRPVYITSGINDLWADNMGEFLSAWHATPVYELYGLQGMPSDIRPKLNTPANTGTLAYRIRSGGHGYQMTDWKEYISFMDVHFNGGEEKR